MYQSFGLTGHRVSGPKTLKNSTAKRRSKRCDKYVVLVKLKRLRTRTRYLERVKQAFGRINTTFKWMIAFFDKDVPVVRILIHILLQLQHLQDWHTQYSPCRWREATVLRFMYYFCKHYVNALCRRWTCQLHSATQHCRVRTASIFAWRVPQSWICRHFFYIGGAVQRCLRTP